MSAWAELLLWMTEDRETRCVEVLVHANDPEYREIGGNDEEAIWSWHYQIEASHVYWYGGDPEQDDPPSMNQVYVGHGDSLIEAAAQVLACMAEVAADQAERS
jgi:hypothetical protein